MLYNSFKMISFLCFISIKKEEFEDTKGVIRIRISEWCSVIIMESQRQYNGKSPFIMENNVIIILYKH